MAWITTIDHENSTDDLKDVYDSIVTSRGKLSNIMRIQSHNPAVMKSHMDLYMDVMFGRSEIRRADRELIATVVSVANECDYCTQHHAEALNAYWKDRDRTEMIISGDLELAGLTPQQLTMLDYAKTLTTDPAGITKEKVEAMTSSGLSDSAILDVNLVVSYFNFVNRIAVGLGVTFDKSEVEGYNY